MGVDLEFVNKTQGLYVAPGVRFDQFQADTEHGARARMIYARLVGEDGPWWFDHVIVSHDHDTASDDCEKVLLADLLPEGPGDVEDERHE